MPTPTFPAMHLSIRVPWHDTAWDGRVCADPTRNTSCLALKRIAKDRAEPGERCCAGRAWADLDEAARPPCVTEHAGLLAKERLVRTVKHPYRQFYPEVFGHVADTRYEHGAYSAACTPYRWLLRKMVTGEEPGCESIAEQYGLRYDAGREARVDALIGTERPFVLDNENQRILLDAFFRAVAPQSSLCFFYAKRTPLAESPRRVLIGAGIVTGVGRGAEYRYEEGTPKGAPRSMLWERDVSHSVRPDGVQGFVLPYQRILELAQTDDRVDPARFVVFAPEETHDAFSYGTEHVSNDHAIAALLAFVPVLELLKEVVEGPWDEHLRWINDQLNRLWKMRGPFPGFGSALRAFGIARGTLVAWRIAALQAQADTTWTEDPWDVLDAAFSDPSRLGDEFREDLGPNYRDIWRTLPDDRRGLLKLLSRFDLSAAQFWRSYDEETLKARGLSTRAVLDNPYRVYLADRNALDAVPLDVVDRGMRPDDLVRAEFPVAAPSALGDDADPRRVGSFVAAALEDAAREGHTVQTRAQVARAVGAHPARPRVPCNADVLRAQIDRYVPWVDALPSGELRLDRYRDTAKRIEDEVVRRVSVPDARRHALAADWRALIDAAIDRPTPAEPYQRVQEERARAEKAASLAELFAARFAVLVGPAGTGKTTLLKALCGIERVSSGGVLLLAPTGKARVQLMKSAGALETRTIAQSLLEAKRYDPLTGAYRMTGGAPTTKGYKTVIIDECSMLTEEALAAVLEDLSGVERLVLVGDPRQLPPIGAGRPFFDIVQRLRPEGVDSATIRVGQSYAELTVVRRQERRVDAGAELRDDVVLASWFAGGAVHPGADEAWERVARGLSPYVRAIRWDSAEELDARLCEAIADSFESPTGDPETDFSATLGGRLFKEDVYFHAQGRVDSPGCGASAEHWQVLSPVRSNPWGVESLNRMIQRRFRPKALARANAPEWRKVPPPTGRDGIIYGDKVICLANGKRAAYAQPDDRKQLYVANGDIGVVVGEFRSRAWRHGGPTNLDVEFKNHPRYTVRFFGNSDFSEERGDRLELAYALTVHKAQGSEFGTVFVVVPSKCRPLSRELLYTALTRQQARVVILHQGDLHTLKDYSGPERSEVARRLTCLLRDARRPLKITARSETFFDENLIHRSAKGDLVRSKSEVIIADMLFHEFSVKDYLYEEPLRAADGSVRYPDFTVEDAATGEKVYIEHLGLLGDPEYDRRWEAKLVWYRAQGILPVDEGGGPNGTLVATSERGGFDGPAVRAVIARALRR